MIHGEGCAVRPMIYEIIKRHSLPTVARRYALCGLGDKLMAKDGDVHVAARGCGNRFCPRCSARFGKPAALRTMRWLAREAHGDIWMMTLTQPVVTGESMLAARARMMKKEKQYDRQLQRMGILSCISTTHIVWSIRHKGWHWHVHKLIESPAGLFADNDLVRIWMRYEPTCTANNSAEASRLVCPAGPAIAALESDDGDLFFWREAADPVAVALQYPIRDMCQGFSAYRFGGDPDEQRAALEECVRDLKHVRMRKVFGRWSKKPPPAPELPGEKEDEGAKAEEAGGVAAAPCGTHLGTVCAVFNAARRGEVWARIAMKRLESSCRNKNDFAARLTAFCRAACREEPKLGG